MFTSNYAKDRKTPGAIGISRGRDRWGFKGPYYEKLMPPQDLLTRYLKCQVSETEYEREYFNRVLRHLNPIIVYSELKALVPGYEPILLCHCAKGSFCHRLLVSEWFNKAGIEVKEL